MIMIMTMTMILIMIMIMTMIMIIARECGKGVAEGRQMANLKTGGVVVQAK